MNIPLSRPDIGPAEQEAVAAVLRTPFLSCGPNVAKFEQAFADYIGVPHAVAMSSGTAALHVALVASGRFGGSVITSPFSFVASANSIIDAEKYVLFGDVDEETLTLDPKAVADLMGEADITGILPVDIFGMPYSSEIDAIAKKAGIPVIEDACEALGATRDGVRAGALGTVGVFGFYPNKQITTGEGGMLVTRDAKIARLARSMRNQGRDAGAKWLSHQRMGWNYRMDEMSAALGLAQMGRLDELLYGRNAVAERYRYLLPNEARTPYPLGTENGWQRSWFVFVIRLEPKARNAVEAALTKAGIETARYFPCIHLMPHYRRLGWKRGQFPVAERASRECLALPFHGRMTAGEVEKVCKVIGKVLR